MQQLLTSMYLASAVDNEMEFCFLLFLSSAFPTQSASEYLAKTSLVSLLYHTPNSAVVLTYLMILFKAVIWDSLGLA